MKKLPWSVVLWWFLTFTSSCNLVQTQGPFSTQKQCEEFRDFAVYLGARASFCWQSPNR